MKTGLNNVLLPTLFTVVNKIVTCVNNVGSNWAAKHCSILLNSGLSVFKVKHFAVLATTILHVNSSYAHRCFFTKRRLGTKQLTHDNLANQYVCVPQGSAFVVISLARGGEKQPMPGGWAMLELTDA